MADFPALKPTARSFQLGEYPIKSYRAMSGAVVRRSFGNKPFGYTLDLEFANVEEATVNAICDHYNNQGGGTVGFTIPTSVFESYSSTLQGKVRAPAGANGIVFIEWLYAGPPSVKSVLRDVSTVTVKLIGEIA
jgi:hypothetical protein